MIEIIDKDRETSSHFMDVPLGMSSITDLLFTSPILGFGGDQGASGLGDYGGANFAMDPDLEMALKLSMEEAKAA